MDSPSFSSLGSNDELTTKNDDDPDAACCWPLHGSQAISSASAGALLPLHRQLPQTVRVNVTPRRRARARHGPLYGSRKVSPFFYPNPINITRLY